MQGITQVLDGFHFTVFSISCLFQVLFRLLSSLLKKKKKKSYFDLRAIVFIENLIIHNVSPNLSRLNGQILVKHRLDPGQLWPNLEKVVENANFNAK